MVKLLKAPGEAPVQYRGMTCVLPCAWQPQLRAEAHANDRPPAGSCKGVQIGQSFPSPHAAHCSGFQLESGVPAQRPVDFWGNAALTGHACMPSPMMLLKTMWACAPELRSARMSKWSGTVLKAGLPDLWRCLVCVRPEACTRTASPSHLQHLAS